jgi:hypothetical protein
MRTSAFALAGSVLAVAACSSSGIVAAQDAATVTSGDAAAVASQDAATSTEGGCGTGVLDAGFSSVADLPIAKLCEDSAFGGQTPMVFEFNCESWTVVQENRDTDCSSFWLFNTATGTLEAMAGGCITFACRALAPGVTFPSECIDPNGPSNGPARQLCAEPPTSDAGSDSGTPIESGTD